MPDIKLPDGKKIPFSKTIDGFEIAKKISKSLAKDACIMSVNGKLRDLSFSIDKDVQVKIITKKDKEGLEVIRHDAAHVLAMAVQELFPGTQVTIGPVIKDGFYYDFSRKETFTDEDLKKIENKMKEIVDRDEPTKREVWKRNEAINHFKKIGEHYKAEIIKMKNFLFIIMVNGMIYVKALTYPQREKLEKPLSLQKYQEHTGEAIQTMKCYKEYMARVGVIKKNWMNIF